MSTYTPSAADPLWGATPRPLGSLSLRVEVADASQVGEARREVGTLARTLGFGEEDAGRAALVATEAATNVARHGGGGALVARAIPATGGAAAALELLALDRGPGIADLARALTDGYSTGGTAGEGLGAMRRLSDGFDLYGAPGQGMAVLLRVRAGREAPPAGEGDLGAVCLPAPGETACGDGWALYAHGAERRLVVVDGLGHGPQAGEAAAAALAAAARLFDARPQATPTEAVQAMHQALRSTRGAAVAVAALDPAAGRVRFAGVGNIAGAVVPGPSAPPDARAQSVVSHNGTAGHVMRKVQEFAYAWPAGALLVLHSDGLGSQWRLDDRPGIAARDAALVAGVLSRDWTRGRDDVTVVVTRCVPPPAA